MADRSALRHRLLAAALAAATACILASDVRAGTGGREPWRLDRALGLPERLSISVEHRLRYERLADQFRPLPDGEDGILVLRTLVHGRLALTDWLTLGAEFQDSRAPVGTSRGVVNTTVVNAAELLRAYAELTADDVFGGELQARGGRITMDVGDRRLVARNRFRNTINAFTGVDATWTRGEALGLRAFYVLPVQRLPNEPRRVRDNEIEVDDESWDERFWGVVADGRLPWGLRGEGFVFGLYQEGDRALPRRERRLVTPGMRVYRLPDAGRVDFQLESVLQLGESRPFDRAARDEDVRAHFHHAEIGYTFGVRWSPHIALQFDYASGDDDPDDGEQNRFDTLFGARRFDFGPTGIYGPFARSNLLSPGTRLQLKPRADVSAFLATRAFWLASDRDFWTTTGIRDASGSAGSYVASQIEVSLAWQVIPGNLAVETGYAHLFAGRFMDDAPGSPARGDADYGYAQLVISF